jgi:hypothetical protein
MAKSTTTMAIADEVILNKIYLVRGQKVMIDRDLAELYGVETKVLKQAVRRNMNRFPPDFLFEMDKEEFENWRSHFVTSKQDKQGLRYAPFCFTEQGVTMLSCVLNSERAIAVNIQIIRIFTRMWEMVMTNQDILLKLEQLERQTLQNTDDIQVVFDQLKQFLIPVEQAERRWIGFRRQGESD